MRGQSSKLFHHAHLHRLLCVYSEQVRTKLSDLSKQKVAENVCITLFRGMSLAEYVTVRRIYCQNYHKSCSKCEPLLRIAELVLSCGYAQLAVAFIASYPTDV